MNYRKADAIKTYTDGILKRAILINREEGRLFNITIIPRYRKESLLLITLLIVYIMIVLYSVVCVCFLPIHSGHQWTYQPGSHRRSEGHTGFPIHLLSAVHALIFLARRIQPSFLSLVDREVEFCVLTILVVLHPLGIYIFVF